MAAINDPANAARITFSDGGFKCAPPAEGIFRNKTLNFSNLHILAVKSDCRSTNSLWNGLQRFAGEIGIRVGRAISLPRR